MQPETKPPLVEDEGKVCGSCGSDQQVCATSLDVRGDGYICVRCFADFTWFEPDEWCQEDKAT